MIKCGHTWHSRGLSCSAVHAECILHRALSSGNVTSWLEPTDLDRAEGKCPDGITMVPWSNGRLLVWDATFADTFAPSHLSPSQLLKYEQQHTRQNRPRSRNTTTSYPMRTIPSHLLHLECVALVPCHSCQTWVAALQTPQLGVKSSLAYLMQKFSVAIQMGNAELAVDSYGAWGKEAFCTSFC